MTPFQTYLVFQADAVCVALAVLATISAVFFMIVTAERLLDLNVGLESKITVRHCLLSLAALLFFTLAAVCCPSTRTLAAVYVVPAITQNEDIREDSREIYDLAVSKLKETLATERTDDAEVRD